MASVLRRGGADGAEDISWFSTLILGCGGSAAAWRTPETPRNIRCSTLSRFTNTRRRRASNTASDDLPTVQTHLLCVGRWLVSGRGQSGAQLWPFLNARDGADGL